MIADNQRRYQTLYIIIQFRESLIRGESLAEICRILHEESTYQVITDCVIQKYENSCIDVKVAHVRGLYQKCLQEITISRTHLFVNRT